uniref:Uncharacterized protein n=1 Tax=Arundo donax TaxID=35708 RepID=A0A0A9FP01_ARUDO
MEEHSQNSTIIKHIIIHPFHCISMLSGYPLQYKSKPK